MEGLDKDNALMFKNIPAFKIKSKYYNIIINLLSFTLRQGLY